MKYLFVFCCFFLFVGSISAQPRFGDLEFEDPDNSGTYVNPFEDGINTTNGGGGNGVPAVTCGTNTTKLSQTTYPCGNSGFVTEIVWQLSCTTGSQGTCTTGTYTEYIIEGCEDVELPDEASSNLTTVECQ